MLATRVDVLEDRGGVGTKISAFTGAFPQRGWLGIWDHMEVSTWEPPRRCDVLHYGKWLRGTGYFELRPLSTHRTSFTWSEELRGAFPLAIKPALAIGVWLSLRRFARQLRSETP
jgi:hypothetical protein